MNCCFKDEGGASKPDEATHTADEEPDTESMQFVQRSGQACFQKDRPANAEARIAGAGDAWKLPLCPARDCSVVYYEDRGSQRFAVDDLRIRVGLKVHDESIPLCYCFGFAENDMRDEIERTGNTSIPDQVLGLIREGLCACEARNPAGVCCLGEVSNATKTPEA